MKKRVFLIILVLAVFLNLLSAQESGWIRINQLGYLPHSVKVAVFISAEKVPAESFTLFNAQNNEAVYHGKTKVADGSGWGMETAVRLDFSEIEKPGKYYLKTGETRSPVFPVDFDVYHGLADFILNYMRQQRCGFNPFLNDSCHTHDGIIVDHPSRSGEYIDVTGGWHDATDYLQYVTTSANAVYQMLFAYQRYPEIFNDNYSTNGLPGKNGAADILDEIRWGINWLLKMNPSPGEMYNQIADDRDHVGFRLPTKDTAKYGLGNYRPVYYVTGEQQGLAKYKNNSDGVSSVAGKFASAFALGAQVFKNSDHEFAALLEKKATGAYRYAMFKPGVTQTACNVSPYYYEETNFTDDIELAGGELFRLTSVKNYINDAAVWGVQEPVTPWMEKGQARHYQYYPFVNLGHYLVGFMGDKLQKKQFTDFYERGLKALYERGKNDPFLNGVPFIWCSNNLVAAALTQAKLYVELSENTKFLEMEAALRDWLFGCNPWGTAMICGLPGASDSPGTPHSSLTVVLKVNTHGGLVDGPVSRSVYEGLLGIKLLEPDEYAPFQFGKAVYHDDIGDYSTNEPTMDGTASLCFYLAMLENEGRKQGLKNLYHYDSEGSIVRISPEKKAIYLAFTADSLFEGGEMVLKTLEKNQIKGSFFFTGNFLRNPAFESITRQIIKQGHYVGAHSNAHLLYCDWQKRDSTLISFKEFKTDLELNFSELQKFGIQSEDARFFMPPYEWYNREIVNWSRELGLDVINFTPGTGTNADYTTPLMKNYKSSEQLFQQLASFEKTNPDHLNGAIILIHPGTETSRTDKFYPRLNDLITYFSGKGYQFKSMKD